MGSKSVDKLREKIEKTVLMQRLYIFLLTEQPLSYSVKKI